MLGSGYRCDIALAQWDSVLGTVVTAAAAAAQLKCILWLTVAAAAKQFVLAIKAPKKQTDKERDREKGEERETVQRQRAKINEYWRKVLKIKQITLRAEAGRGRLHTEGGRRGKTVAVAS